MGPGTAATTLGQSKPVTNGDEEVLNIPKGQGLERYKQFSVIFRTIVGGRSYLLAEIQLAYSTAPFPAD